MALHVVTLAQQYAVMANAPRAEIEAEIKQLQDELQTQLMPELRYNEVRDRLSLLRLRLLVDAL